MSGDILSPRFRNNFENSLSPARQHQAIDALKDYISELKHGTDEQRRQLGVLGTGDVDQEVVEGALERGYWQLVMFFRYSHPCRIAEAEPYLRIIFSKLHARPTPSPAHLHEIHTALYLAAALAAPPPAPSTPTPPPSNPTYISPPSAHISPYSAVTTPSSSIPSTPPSEPANGYQSREAEALSLFTRAFALYDAPSPSRSPSPPKTHDVALTSSLPHMRLSPAPQTHFGVHHSRVLGPKTELWTRASYAALLRRLGREAEAAGVVNLIRLYVARHPYALPSEKYHKLLQDIEHDFGVTLLDATLSVETEVALGPKKSLEDREIEHVEDVGNDDDDVSAGEDDDDSSESATGVASPVLLVSPPTSSSSDSDSSAESSLANSPITPSSSHFPPNLLVKHPGASVQSHPYGRDVVDRLSQGVGRLAFSGSPQKGSSVKVQAMDEPEDIIDEEEDGPKVIGYGAL